MDAAQILSQMIIRYMPHYFNPSWLIAKISGRATQFLDLAFSAATTATASNALHYFPRPGSCMSPAQAHHQGAVVAIVPVISHLPVSFVRLRKIHNEICVSVRRQHASPLQIREVLSRFCDSKARVRVLETPLKRKLTEGVNNRRRHIFRTLPW